MLQNKTSNQLATAWCEQQAILADLQREESTEYGCTAEACFYLKTLSGLAVCDELIKSSIQLKEINRNKIATLRRRINEVSARMDAFRDMLNRLQKPF